jgi:hypothetical protein
MRRCASLSTINPTRVDLGLNAYPYVEKPQLNPPIHGTALEDISLGVKWPEFAAHYSTRSIGDVKN